MPQAAAATQKPRPDRRHGVIETLLLVDDLPIELDAHLERLAESVRAVFGEDPPDTRDLVLAGARGVELGRLRLTVAPRPQGRFETSVVVAAVDPANVFPTGELAATLSTMTVDRGLGEHKWADRAILERAEAAGPPGSVPLLVTEDGSVLEASRGNVFTVRGAGLLTPPLDGRILPGIARARVIEIARESGIEVTEAPLSIAGLLTSEEVFLTGSIRGVEPVAALDEEALPRGGRITSTIAAALRARWLPS